MNKIRSRNVWLDIKYFIAFLSFVFFTISLFIIIDFRNIRRGYSVFIEFSSAHGIKKGTNLRMRGVNIGAVQNIKISYNSVLVSAYLHSNNILIPKNSIVETNQTGLLNEAVIDIIPLDIIKYDKLHHIDPFSSSCLQSDFICHLSYLEGDRGLNYDDLVRATTRISQRFDDPRFFNLFYIFLQNSIDVADSILDLTVDLSDIVVTISYSMYKFIEMYLNGL